jgi:hypothetical protein
MLNKTVLLVGIILVLSTIACSLNILPIKTSVDIEAIKTGPTVTEDILVSVPSADWDEEIEILFGVGELSIIPGAGDALIEGRAVYNVAEFKPRVTSENGTLRLQSGDEKSLSGLQVTIPDFEGRVENKWDLQLGQTPLALTINAGASSSKMELGGLSLLGLTVSQGVSDFEVTFSEPNQAEMEVLRFNAGASKAVLSGLANANAEEIIFKGGAGSYTLDFTGDLAQDVQVIVEAGVGGVEIIVPEGVAAEIVFDGALTDVDAYDSWRRTGNRFTLEGTGPEITFEISMGLGSLKLRNR